MFLAKKASKWAEEGLLTSGQVEKIIAFEKERGSGRMMRGLYGLGAFAILVGVLAIIAANWQIIPPYIKVSVHLLVNSILVCCVFLFDKRDRVIAREISAFALMGLTLTFIALVGQVFHLDGSIASALVLWMGLSTPFVVVYGRTNVSLVPWLIGFVVAIFAAIYEYVYPHFDRAAQELFAVGVCILLPFAFIQVAGVIQKIERPVLQKLLFYAGIMGAVIGPNIACQFWYDDHTRDFINGMGIWVLVIGLFAIAAVWTALISFSSRSGVVQRLDNTCLLLFGGLAVSVWPFIFPHVESDVLAAVTFISYWVYVGFIGQRAGMQWLVSTSIVLIAIRIYLIYLEVFGSMLETGFGLVVSGLLLIGMVWGVRALNKSLNIANLKGEDYE